MAVKQFSIPKWVLCSITEKDAYIRDLCKSKLGVVPIRYECYDGDAVVRVEVYRWVEAST